METYQQVHAPQEVDEATAMAKRGYDETKLRKRAGGGEAADRATSLENRPTYGDKSKEAQRSRYARAQRGDFRNTASSNPGLHVGQHKSDDPKVKAKQAARGAQRGALTPNEKKQLNMGDETFDLFDVIMEFLCVEGYAETLEDAEWIMANIIDEEAIDIILGEEQLDEISLKTKISAFKNRATREFESDGDNPKDFTKSGESKADITIANIVNKHGKKAGQHAKRAAHAGIFGRKSFSMPKKPTNEELDIFDVVLEFLQAEGYAETLEEAEWLMANVIDEEEIGIILGEADSIAKMRERAAKRRQQRYGKQGGGGRDDFRPYTKADYERGEANDPRKKK